MTDQDLLTQFRRNRSEKAFRLLVERHCDLVHGVAHRVTRSAELAADVSQQVFLKLSKRPPAVSGAPLAAWLHRVARCSAIDMVRHEEARRRRELSLQTPDIMKRDTEPDWDALSPWIDEIVDALPELDRKAVVMRFFENRSFGAIGEQLGLSPEAARKRVARALESIQRHLRRKGILTSASLIATILPGHAVSPAPSGLAAVICQSIPLSASAPIISSTKIYILLTMKKKAILGIAALVALSGTAIIIASNQSKAVASDSAGAETGLAGATKSRFRSSSRGDREGAFIPEKGEISPARRAEIASMSAKFGDRRLTRATALSSKVVQMMDRMAQIMETFAAQGELEQGVREAVGRLEAAPGEPLVVTPEMAELLDERVREFVEGSIAGVRAAATRGRSDPSKLERYFLLQDALRRDAIQQAEFDQNWTEVEDAMDFNAVITNSGETLMENVDFVKSIEDIVPPEPYADLLRSAQDAEAANEVASAAEAQRSTLEESEDKVHETLQGLEAVSKLLKVQKFFNGE